MSDPRTLLAAPGLADVRLQGVMPAQAYGVTAPMRCRAPAAGLHAGPDAASEMTDQLLFGETFEVLEEGSDWSFGQARRAGYVGYVRAWALKPGAREPTHRVSALRACALAAPDLKAPTLGHYGMNCLLRVEAVEGAFAHDPEAGFFAIDHLTAVGTVEADPAAVAERFLGAPYQWGARDGVGVDCSGLVQQALHACGLACPRDADQQLALLGRPVEPGRLARGDLVFWTGHVGMMLDGERLVHASGDCSAVVTEPLTRAAARISELGRGAPIAYRRL